LRKYSTPKKRDKTLSYDDREKLVKLTTLIPTEMIKKHTRIAAPKIKVCPVCEKQFTYVKSNTIYCSNACKCKAYQQRIGKAEKPHKKTVKNNEVNSNQELLSIIQEQRQYIDWIHAQMQENQKDFKNIFKEIESVYEEALEESRRQTDNLLNLIRGLIEEKKENQSSEALTELAAKFITSKGVFK